MYPGVLSVMLMDASIDNVWVEKFSTGANDPDPSSDFLIHDSLPANFSDAECSVASHLLLFICHANIRAVNGISDLVAEGDKSTN